MKDPKAVRKPFERGGERRRDQAGRKRGDRPRRGLGLLGEGADVGDDILHVVVVQGAPRAGIRGDVPRASPPSLISSFR